MFLLSVCSFSDAGLTWEPNVTSQSTDKWSCPSAHNMIRNTLNRYFMHKKWFINDPDCLLLRDELPFTDEEVIGIATTKALTGGSLMISDDIAKISPKRMKIFQKLIPTIPNQTVCAVDLMEKEIPEFFRIVFLSNHNERIHQEFSPGITNNNDNNNNNLPGKAGIATTHEVVLDPSLYSPFEAILYKNTRSYPKSPNLQRSMFDSLDFVEERIRLATVQLSYSDDELDSLDSFEDDEEDHADFLLELPETMNMMIINQQQQQQQQSLPHQMMMMGGGHQPMMVNSPSNSAASRRLPETHLQAVPSMDSIQPRPSSYPPSSSIPVRSGAVFSTPNQPAAGTNNTSYNWTGGSNSGTSTPRGGRGGGGSLIPMIPKGTIITLEMRCQGIKEKWLDKRDLNKRWIVFSVSNWSKEMKTQFIHLKLLFTEEYLQEFTDYTRFLYDPNRKGTRSSMQSLYSSKKGGGGGSRRSLSLRQFPRSSLPGSALGSIRELQPSSRPESPSNASANSCYSGTSYNTYNRRSSSSEIHHVLHLFNFWNESYSYKIINLLTNNEEENEIAFPDVPSHSSHIYAVHLSLHPRIPKYLGSNLHFSCGKEIRHFFMTETLPSTTTKLNEFVERCLAATMFNSESTAAATTTYNRSSRSSSKSLSPIPTPTSAGLAQNKFRKRAPTPKNSTVSPLNIQNALSSSFYGPMTASSFVPVIQTICIGFEDQILHDPDWNGFIWVYLPINIKRAKLFQNIVGKVEVTGTVWDGDLKTSETENEKNNNNNTTDSVSSKRNESFGFLSPNYDGGNNTGNNNNHNANIQIVEYIEETSCRNAGYVYKIKVSSSRFRLKTENEKNQKIVEDAVKDLEEKKFTLSQKKKSKKQLVDGGEGEGEDILQHWLTQSNDSTIPSSNSSCVGVVWNGGGVGTGGGIDYSVSRGGSYDDGGNNNMNISRSMSMSATMETIGMNDFIPKPLKFDQRSPGIDLLTSTKYQSPSRPLQLSNVMNLKKGGGGGDSSKDDNNESVDYLIISWISDMEEKVVPVDTTDKMFFPEK
jgi:hypothetical protein